MVVTPKKKNVKKKKTWIVARKPTAIRDECLTKRKKKQNQRDPQGKLHQEEKVRMQEAMSSI